MLMQTGQCSLPRQRIVQVRTGVAVDVPDYLLDLITSERCRPREAEGRVYRALFRAANRGDACPSQAVLAMIVGYESEGGTVKLLQRLEARGMIRVERFNRSRRVTIVATKKRTAKTGETEPHWRFRGTLHQGAK